MKDRPAKYMITLTDKDRRFPSCSGKCLGFVRESVPLTDFQKKIYKKVAKIPRGKVCSYKYIAAKIGKPEAYRAVANALKKNPFIGKVPCHRVIKSDGTIGGFSRGIAMKKKLLKDEGLTIRGDTVIINK